ncbi:MAG: hypothetical protein ACRDTA_07520 [Pseudonocardiaceae bacterium]
MPARSDRPPGRRAGRQRAAWWTGPQATPVPPDVPTRSAGVAQTSGGELHAELFLLRQELATGRDKRATAEEALRGRPHDNDRDTPQPRRDKNARRGSPSHLG